MAGWTQETHSGQCVPVVLKFLIFCLLNIIWYFYWCGVMPAMSAMQTEVVTIISTIIDGMQWPFHVSHISQHFQLHIHNWINYHNHLNENWNVLLLLEPDLENREWWINHATLNLHLSKEGCTKYFACSCTAARPCIHSGLVQGQLFHAELLPNFCYVKQIVKPWNVNYPIVHNSSCYS